MARSSPGEEITKRSFEGTTKVPSRKYARAIGKVDSIYFAEPSLVQSALRPLFSNER